MPSIPSHVGLFSGGRLKRQKNRKTPPRAAPFRKRSPKKVKSTPVAEKNAKKEKVAKTKRPSARKVIKPSFLGEKIPSGVSDPPSSVPSRKTGATSATKSRGRRSPAVSVSSGFEAGAFLNGLYSLLEI